MKRTTLQRAIDTLNRRRMAAEEWSHIGDIDPRALLGVTLVYLVAMLSVNPQKLGMLLWFAVYPIVTAPLAHIRYERVALQSLIVLPLLIAIGIFNPIFDRTVSFSIGSIAVSHGWISFISIIVRGLLSMQALLLLIHITGFNNICIAMNRLGLPLILANQLMMLYRYIGVLLEESLDMTRARQARGFGHPSLPLRLWGEFTGQLLLRTLDRSRRISRAMAARGFAGNMSADAFGSYPQHWQTADTVYCIVWIGIIVLLRSVDLSSFITQIISR